MKKIYSFDPDTRVLSGEAEYIPPRPMLFVKGAPPKLPAGTTLSPPPATGAREAAWWSPDANAWEVVPDYRGVHLYSPEDGTYAPIAQVGVTPAETGAVETPRPDPSHIWDAQAALWVVDQSRRRAFAAVAVRAERDALLITADRLISKAVDNGEDPAALRAYRQALRDLPDQPGFAENVEWPEVPL